MPTDEADADVPFRKRLKEACAKGAAAGLRATGYVAPVPYGDQLADVLLKRFGPAGAPIEVRAQQVRDALVSASELLDELQAEVKLRSVIIEKLGEQRVEAEQRTADALLRASMSEEEARAVDSLVDRVLQTRLKELERNARRREWTIGTAVALVVGVASILASHFAFGF